MPLTTTVKDVVDSAWAASAKLIVSNAAINRFTIFNIS
jgi:hypothetical protein